MTQTTEFSYDFLIDQASKYNFRLQSEKKARLPFLDGATGIAQRPSTLMKFRYQRYPGIFKHHVYCYPSIHWKKSKRSCISRTPVFKSEIKLLTGVDNNSTRCDFDETMEPDYCDYDSDDSDYLDETYGPKRKKKGRPGSNRFGRITSLSTPITSQKRGRPSLYSSGSGAYGFNDMHNSSFPSLNLDDSPGESKPCSGQFKCDQCGQRYKSRTGLSYHISSQHKGGGSAPGLAPDAHLPDKNTPEINNTSLNALLINDTSMSSMGDSNMAPPLLTPMEDINGNDELNRNSENPGIGTNCDFCFGDENLNKKTMEAEKMARCSDCGRCAHYSCLQFTANMIQSSLNYPWQCIECKTCWICGTSENDEKMLFCDDCDRGYHMYCLKPPIEEPPDGNWSCDLCMQEFYDDNSQTTSTNSVKKETSDSS